MDDLAYGKPINETVKTRVPEAIKTTAREIDWKAGSAEPTHKRWPIYNWACLRRPKGDSRLFFWFSAIQLVHVCLVSYRGQLIAEVFSMSMGKHFSYKLSPVAHQANVDKLDGRKPEE